MRMESPEALEDAGADLARHNAASAARQVTNDVGLAFLDAFSCRRITKHVNVHQNPFTLRFSSSISRNQMK